MKDRKSLYLLICALIVVTIAFTLISVWGYRFYFSKKSSTSLVAASTKNIAGNKNAGVNQLPLDSAVRQLNDVADTIAFDSADHQLAVKIIQFNRLKNEIALILQERYFAKDSTAETKIEALEKEIERLQKENFAVTKENARLSELVKQLNEGKHKENAEKLASAFDKNKPQTALFLPLLVSHLRFAAYNNQGKTVLASETTKLKGSFEISVRSQNAAKEIYVVIVQPNGLVMLSGSGTRNSFETNSGRKAYTAVVGFDYEKDNHKRLEFTCYSGTFLKGKYTMQIYHNGIMIGRLVKRLY